MANRFVLNETSYHGAGAIKSIADEVKGRGFKKALVCSDPDLVKFGVTKKVLDVMDEAGLAYIQILSRTLRLRMFSQVLLHVRRQRQIISWQLAVVLQWIQPRQSVLSLPILSLQM